MLKIIRKKGVMKKILWVLAVVIIISFGFLGRANYLNRGRKISHAGKIFGRTVDFDEFEKSLRYAYFQALMRYGEDFHRMKDYLNLDQEAWDRLILLREARKRRIKIDDSEVIQTIREMPTFNVQGRFDQQMYEKILRYVFQTRPRDFEESVRETLIFARLFEHETQNITISNEELLEQYQKQNEKIQVHYVIFKPQDYLDQVQTTPEEIRAHFENNKENFRLPKTYNVRYLYKKFPSEATDEQKQETAESMQEISGKLKEGVTLEEAAKQYNLILEETGPYSRRQPNLKVGWSAQLLIKSFELDVGQISEPLETRNGYYILKMKEREESRLPKWDEVREEVEKDVLHQKADQLAQSKAKQAFALIQKTRKAQPDKNFPPIAQSLNLEVETTPPLTRGEYVPKIGPSQEFFETAFSLTEDDPISEAVATRGGYCLIALDQFFPIDKEKFEKEKETLRQELLAKKKGEAFQRFITNLRLKANLEDNISELRKQQQSPQE